jgi:hypothetical protein
LPGGIGQMVESQLLVFVFCGKHQQKFSATRQYLLLAKRSIRHSKQSPACCLERRHADVAASGGKRWYNHGP